MFTRYSKGGRLWREVSDVSPVLVGVMLAVVCAGVFALVYAAIVMLIHPAVLSQYTPRFPLLIGGVSVVAGVLINCAEARGMLRVVEPGKKMSAWQRAISVPSLALIVAGVDIFFALAPAEFAFFWRWLERK